MFDWLKWKSEAKAPEMAGAFQEAAFGRFFQTRTFTLTQENSQKQEWLEAMRIHGQGWQVMRKARLKDTADVQQEICARSLDFPAAVKYLAEYEVGQAAKEYASSEEAELKRLGLKHVRAFAEREGMAFDSNGLPHVTEEGLITVAGTFPSDAADKAMAAWEKKKEVLPDILDTSAPISISSRDALAIVDQIMNLKDLDGLFVKTKNFVAARNNYQDWGCWIDHGPKYIGEVGSEGKYADKTPFSTFVNGLAGDRKEYLGNLDKIFGKNTDKGLKAQFVMAWDIMEFLSYMNLAAIIYQKRENPAWLYRRENLEKMVSAAEKKLKILGAGDNAGKIIYRRLEARNDCVAEMEKIVSWVRQSTAALKQQIEATMLNKNPEQVKKVAALPKPSF